MCRLLVLARQTLAQENMATGKSSFLQKFQGKVSVVGKDGSHAKVGEVREGLNQCVPWPFRGVHHNSL